MSITELIKAVGGDGSVQVQFLDNAMTGITTDKHGGSKITFGTRVINATQVATDSDKIGLVVWLDRKKVNEAIKQSKS